MSIGRATSPVASSSAWHLPPRHRHSRLGREDALKLKNGMPPAFHHQSGFQDHKIAHLRPLNRHQHRFESLSQPPKQGVSNFPRVNLGSVEQPKRTLELTSK